MSTLPANAKPSNWNRDYDKLTDKDRQEMLVDEIFALYLYRMSNRINQNYYKVVLAYVIFFRECLNEYGWGKKIESEGIRLDNNPELKLDIETKQFCLVILGDFPFSHGALDAFVQALGPLNLPKVVAWLFLQ